MFFKFDVNTKDSLYGLQLFKQIQENFGQFSMNYQKDKDKRTFHLKSDNQAAFQHNKIRTHKKQRQNNIFPF